MSALENGRSNGHTAHAFATATDVPGVEISGTIKWYDSRLGYGFIVPDGGGEEVFLYHKQLRAGGYPAPTDGARIVCRVALRGKGLKCISITSLANSTGKPPLEHMPDLSTVKGFEPAKVKWFNWLRGFGFVTRGGGTPDIFVHAEVCEACGVGELMPDQQVWVKYALHSSGLRAIAIRLKAVKGH